VGGQAPENSALHGQQQTTISNQLLASTRATA